MRGSRDADEWISLSPEVKGLRRGQIAVLIPERPGGFQPAVHWLRESSERAGGPLGLAVVVRPSCERPDAKTARGIEEVMSGAHDCIRCHSTVILGQGFFASILISFASRVFINNRWDTTPRALHTDLTTASRWMAAELSDVDADEIAELLAMAAAT